MTNSAIAVMRGIAVVHDVVDAFNTEWAPGCFRSSEGPISRGEVPLFLDHGGSVAPGQRYYSTKLHIGTVRSLEEITLPSGKRATEISGSIFDTAEGRQAVEYLQAVLGSKSGTGLSVAVPQDRSRGISVSRGGARVFRFTDTAPLTEISVTVMQAVPGAIVTGLTMRPAKGWATDQQKADALRASYGWRPPKSDYGWTPKSERRRLATMAERRAALRRPDTGQAA